MLITSLLKREALLLLVLAVVGLVRTEPFEEDELLDEMERKIEEAEAEVEEVQKTEPNRGLDCTQMPARAAGARCADGYARWLPIKEGYYVPKSNIRVELNVTLAACRRLCWAEPKCESADFTTPNINGVGKCYLNNKATDATYGDSDEHWLAYECCEKPVLINKCTQLGPRPAGSRCADGYAKWLPIKEGYYVPYSNVRNILNVTLETCRRLCWAEPKCQSADFTTPNVNGVGKCYLNTKAVDAKYGDSDEHWLTYECCEKDPIVINKCTQMEPRPIGARCADGYAMWLPNREGYYVPWNNIRDIMNVTIGECRQWCWAEQKCESADFTTPDVNGLGKCYLNTKATDAKYGDTDEHLLTFECCKKDPIEINKCTRMEPRHEGARCADGYAKWLPNRDGYYVPWSNVRNIVNVTIEECRRLCWREPKCESADFTTSDITGVGKCYLNTKATDAKYGDTDEHLLTFECCGKEPITEPIPEPTTPAPTTTKRPNVVISSWTSSGPGWTSTYYYTSTLLSTFDFKWDRSYDDSSVTSADWSSYTTGPIGLVSTYYTSWWSTLGENGWHSSGVVTVLK